MHFLNTSQRVNVVYFDQELESDVRVPDTDLSIRQDPGFDGKSTLRRISVENPEQVVGKARPGGIGILVVHEGSVHPDRKGPLDKFTICRPVGAVSSVNFQQSRELPHHDHKGELSRGIPIELLYPLGEPSRNSLDGAVVDQALHLGDDLKKDPLSPAVGSHHKPAFPRSASSTSPPMSF